MHTGFAAPSREDSAEFLAIEALRILEAVTANGPQLRLTGSVAVQARCPIFGHLARAGRIFHDIDFVAYKRDAKQIQRFLNELGYVEDREVSIVSEGSRAIFEHGETRLHIDVFYDKLDFCHVISLEGRIESDAPTLPLAELLLAKLQIVQINEKDLVDAIVLLLEHPLGDRDAGAINLARVAKLCAEDWGLWRTATMNLGKAAQLAAAPGLLSDEQRGRVTKQLQALGAGIEAAPKPLAWRLRARVGDRVKWYKDVEDVR